MRRLVAALALVCATAAPSGALAQEVLPCTSLPPVAWDAPPVTTFPVVRHVGEVALPNVTGAKELYLQAVCGVQNAAVWRAVERGHGALLEIPAPLAASLDRAVPYLPTVRFLYVRGGGRDREVVVFLFADGLDTRYFRTDGQPWSAANVAVLGRTLDALPYEFLRRASLRLHDFSNFGAELTLVPELQWFLDLFGFDNNISHVGGMAPWNGHCLLRRDRVTPEIITHELAHYVDWHRQGRRASAMAWTDEFGRISFTNGRVLGVRIPFLFRHRFEPARLAQNVCMHATGFDLIDPHAACPSGQRYYWGHVSDYARTNPIEDLAETITHALEFSQGVRELGDPYWGDRDSRVLYARSSDDAPLLSDKARFVYDLLRLHGLQPQDADGDGVTWAPGRSPSDCDDDNPVLTSCEETTCRVDADCDDGDPCTLDRCQGNACQHPIRDTDWDGSPDGACGGTDCADADPAVREGSTRPCTNRCGAPSTQSCIGPAWSECAGPATCGCRPGETTVAPCGGRCGVTTLTCSSSGSWIDPGVCDPGSEGICAAGSTRERRESRPYMRCGVRRTIVTEQCNASCTGWVEIASRPAGSAHSPEICDGVDNDCDGTADEGCPEGVVFGTASPSAYLGEGSGDRHSVSCPPGYVVRGVEMRSDTYRPPLASAAPIVRALRPICVRPVVAPDRSSTPWRYTIHQPHWRTHPLPWQGPSSSGPSHAVMCPTDQVVIGAHVRKLRPTVGRRFLQTVELECAPLMVAGGRGTFLIRRGSGTRTPGAFGPPANEHATCLGDGAVTGLQMRWSSGGFKGFALLCSDPTVGLLAPAP